MARRVEVLPYREEWKEQFAEESKSLQALFGAQLVAVHHFGSTSIPGASAKPIIDILVTVREIQSVDDLTPELAKMGYVAVGEYGIPGRRFFYKGTSDLRTHHLHVYQSDSPDILRHIAFRDYMCTHPTPAQQYSRLKEDLARAFPEDMEAYIAGKNAFIKRCEVQAMDWWAEHQKNDWEKGKPD